MISIFTLTSPLHNEEAVNKATEKFLGSLGLSYTFHGSDFTTYGQDVLNIIYVRTGGTEGVLKPLLPNLKPETRNLKPEISQPFYLLTSGESNSLAASMEILSYLRQQNLPGEIIHGSPEYIHNRICLLSRVEEAKRRLHGMRLGVIGKPSDWLISSNADYEAVRATLGIELVDIPIEEVKAVYDETPDGENAELLSHASAECVKKALPGALRIYKAIKTVVDRHNLQGFTIRCFDLLTAVHNTGCIALAKLNSEGYVAGCEGDVPALLSMAITRAITGTTWNLFEPSETSDPHSVSGFQANPARINPETGEMLFAHCTIPFNMLQRYELDTHFESGIGVGVRGYMKEGPVTIFKVSGNLSRHFIAEATLVKCQAEPNLCRTQQVIQLDNPADARYFLTNPIGNHHIILPGHLKQELQTLLT